MSALERMSFSSLNGFIGYGSCELNWYYSRIEKAPPDKPKGQQLVLGTAFDAGVQAAYNAKLAGEQPAADLMIGEAIDAWNAEMSTGEYENDQWSNLPGTLPTALREYATDVAPNITPTAVQHPIEIGFDEVDWKFYGYIDVLGSLLDGSTVLIDAKATAGSTRYNPEEDLQLNLYALAQRYTTGEAPEQIGFHVARVQKTQARVEQAYDTVTPDSLDRASDMLVDGALRIGEAMEAGRFLPTARLARSWKCSEKFCEFYPSTCPYGARGRKAPAS